MKRITRLTERDLTRIAKKVVKEYWYEDDDDAHDEYVDERDELVRDIMSLLKPFYEKHGLEITVDLVDFLEDFVKDCTKHEWWDNY